MCQREKPGSFALQQQFTPLTMALQQRVSTRSRTAFSGVRVAGHGASVRAVAMNRSRGVSVNAMVREWPDKEFIAETLSIFPDEGVANAEQARVRLLSTLADLLLNFHRHNRA